MTTPEDDAPDAHQRVTRVTVQQEEHASVRYSVRRLGHKIRRIDGGIVLVVIGLMLLGFWILLIKACFYFFMR